MLLLEPTFASVTSLPLSLSQPDSPSAFDNLDHLDFTLLSSTSPEAKSNHSDSSEGALTSSELSDFNIAQLQLQYETSSMDSSLNMHSVTSIDLLNDHPHHIHHHSSHLDPDQDIEDSDYAARRMSSSAISSASAQSVQSVHTSSTAATSHSGYSARHGQSLKRTSSPGIIDDFDSYDAFDSSSPRVKRPRPSLSLEPGVGRLGSSSPAPTNTTASAGANSGDGSNSGGTGRVQLPPLFSAIENTSNSAPPTSHGTQASFAQQSSQIQQGFSQQSSPSSHAMGQGQGQSPSPFPSSNFAFNVTGTGLDLRRGSLPSLYSNSLAARSAQRLPTSQGQYLQNQPSGGRYGFSSGMSPGPSPLSSLSAPDASSNDASGLAGYQFPPATSSSSMDSGNTSAGSNGSGSTPTPTPNSGSGLGASPFGSGATPTSTLSSTPSSTFPQTPLDFSSHQHQSHSASPYQTAYGQQSQGQKDYLSGGADWGSLGRSSSSPSSATTNTPGFGFNTSNTGLGGLPRISGHGHAKSADQQQQQEWFSPSGQLVLPSPTANTSSSPSNQQQQHPQTASLSPSPRMHPSSSASSAATSAAVAAAAALNVSPAAAVQAAQVAAQVAARPARRRGKLPKPTTDFLKDWLHRHSDHPYPSEEEKKQLCHATGLSMSQVSNWMINARRRILAPAQRTPQGPTTTVPSYPLGSSHSSGVGRTPLGLSPAHPHSISSSHLSHSQSSYGLGMGSSMGNMGLGLIGGLGSSGMGYSQHTAGHQLHAAQGLGLSSGMFAQQQQQQYRQQQQAALGHSALYDLGLHAQRRASMPAITLHSQAHLSPLGGSSSNNGSGGLQLYPPPSTTRSSLPGPSPLPQVGFTSQHQHQQSAYSPQSLGSPAAAAPMPQRGYVFPPPSATAGVSSGPNGGSGNVIDDGR